MAGPVTSLTPGPISEIVAPTRLAGIHTAPSFDVIQLLPERAQDRLRKLRVRRDDARAVTIAFADIQEASALKQDAQRALSRLVDHRSSGGYELPPDDGRVVFAAKQLATATDDLKRLQERAEDRSQAFQAASSALSSAESWLRHGVPGGTAQVARRR